MRDSSCLNCSGRRQCRNELRSWLLFFVGLAAAIAVRLVTVLMHLDPFYGKVAWYVGVVGFLLFFAAKYLILRKQSALIEKANLLAKINGDEHLDASDRGIISAILCEARSRKVRINYLLIVILSIIALTAALLAESFGTR